jgi:hypothetical protein
MDQVFATAGTRICQRTLNKKATKAMAYEHDRTPSGFVELSVSAQFSYKGRG